MTARSFKEILSDLNPETRSDNGFLLESFLDWTVQRGISLYPAQEAAVLEIFEGKNIILNTPTGSGKSLVASVLHYQSLAQNRISVYTCPIKALVNEKWMTLCKEFGAENVGLSTGDATVNRNAPILCCTAEILANIALCEGAESRIGDVVMDEFHYYSDRERGVAWQVPLLVMKNTRFLLMSATLGDTGFFETELSTLNGRPTVTVKSLERPVPLHFSYSEKALPEAVHRLVVEGKAPVYIVHFTQADAARNAQNFTSLELCNKDEKSAIANALQGFRFSSPFGPDIKRWLRQGIGLHHAGLLPKYRILVEKLAQQGLLKVICGTDTLGVGVNVPIRTVLFTQLCKYSGDKTAILTVRDFHQISGRAGRKGFDDAGFVVAQAPEHVVENLKLSAKTAQSGKKFVKRKPPEKGYVPWDEGTFRRLIDGSPEKLVSRFQVSHGMLIHVLGRVGDGCSAMRELIAGCHDTAKAKSAHVHRAFQLFRPLVERGIVEIKPSSQNNSLGLKNSGHKLRVNLDLQQNFSMDQTLSLYLMETLPFLNPESPDHHLDILTLVESILEDPDQVLRRQLDKLKTERMTELKVQGVEFDQRVAELDAMEYPKPLREFVYSSFNAFSEKHPWVGNENIRPKSIAREMMEGFFTFSNYVKGYALERSEGLLLRYLNSVYKVLANTVPTAAKTEAVREMEDFFGEMLRRVDSSLLEEWQKLQNPNFQPVEETELKPPGEEVASALDFDVTTDTVVFTAEIRARIFSFMAALSRSEYENALDALTEGLEETNLLEDAQAVPWTAERLRNLMAEYRPGHGVFRLDPEGRAVRHTLVNPKPGGEKTSAPFWEVRQMLQDHEGHNDWVIDFSVDLAASRLVRIPVLRLSRMGEMQPGQ